MDISVMSKLVCTSAENKLADSDQIFDTNKQKFLSTILQELEAKIGDVDGIAVVRSLPDPSEELIDHVYLNISTQKFYICDGTQWIEQTITQPIDIPDIDELRQEVSSAAEAAERAEIISNGAMQTAQSAEEEALSAGTRANEAYDYVSELDYLLGAGLFVVSQKSPDKWTQEQMGKWYEWPNTTIYSLPNPGFYGIIPNGRDGYKPYVRQLTTGDGTVEEAPIDNRQYARKNGIWSEVQIPDDIVTEAPVDDKQYARKNGDWVEIEDEPEPEKRTIKVDKLEDYLYEIKNVANKTWQEVKEREDITIPGGCTMFSLGSTTSANDTNLCARWFDWFYDNSSTFVVHIAGKSGIEDPFDATVHYTRNSIIGTAVSSKLTKDIVESEVANEQYDYVDYYLVDGMNRHGLYLQMNVVNKGDLGYYYCEPLSGEGSISSSMLIRYLLERCSNYSDVMSTLSSLASSGKKVTTPKVLSDNNYYWVIGIKDKNGTCGCATLAHPVGAPDIYVSMLSYSNNWDITPGQNLHTNFFMLTNVMPGMVHMNDAYSPDFEFANHGYSSNRFSTGTGRMTFISHRIYDDLVEGFSVDDDPRESWVGNCELLMYMYDNFKYSYIYDDLFSECQDDFYGTYTKDGHPFEFSASDGSMAGIVYDIVSNANRNRDRNNPTVWHTAHFCIYDLNNNFFYIYSQENNKHHKIVMNGSSKLPMHNGGYIINI